MAGLFYYIRNRYHSYLRAVIGFKSEALYAGKKPKINPTIPEKLNGSNT